MLLFIHFYINSRVPIRIWDEAVYANNAIEMNESGELFILQSNQGVQLYNTKPPLAIWLQSISIELFGINEMAIRLPTLLALIGIVLAIIFFIRKVNKGTWLGVLVVSVLLTSRGFMGNHVGSTGDLDAILAFWSTLFALLLFDLLIDSSRVKLKGRLRLLGFFFIGGFMTKSTAMFLILPSLFVCLLVSKKLKYLIWNKQTVLVFSACISCVCAYYFYMERLVPDYIEKVWFSEVERFYKDIMSWHVQPWNFYFKNLLHRFWPWIVAWVPLAIIAIKSKEKSLSWLSLYSTIHVTGYLLFISIPSIKLEWYDAPIYPFLAIAAGIGLFEIAKFIKFKFGQKGEIIYLSLFLLLVGLMYLYIISPKNSEPLIDLEKEGSFINKSFQNKNFKKCIVVMEVEHPEHYEQLYFYIKKYKKEVNAEISITPTIKTLVPNDTVFVCQKLKIDSIMANFNFETISQQNGCLQIRILGPSINNLSPTTLVNSYVKP
jgi:4-amino-4-deoxy-L-arabinose transferase-like glycosyltransferase